MKKALFILIFHTSFTIHAQDNQSGFGIASDSTESNYQNQDAMGGPKTIGTQLKVDNQKKESYFRVPVRVTKGWYDWKAKLAENTGLQLGINYTSVFIRSSNVIETEGGNDKDPTASSGILDAQLGWNLVGRKSGKNKGTLFAKMSWRHSYDDDKTPPMFHGLSESGYVGLPAVGFNDYSARLLEFHWQQMLLDDKLTLIFGKIDVTNYLNFHGLVIPWTSFLGYGSSLSGTVNWPNQGWGVAAGYKITDQLHVIGVAADVYGDLLNDGDFMYMGDHFFDGNLFKAIEVAWTPSYQERYFKRISLTYHHTDSYVSAGGSDVSTNQGLAFSAHWFFDNKYAPYVRFATSDGVGENAFYKNDIQIGNGFLFRSHDLVGLSFSSAAINGIDKRQHTMELYYRFQLTEHLALTPDLQWIMNPGLNPNEDNIWYFGMRARATF